jgi:broad specificity phosphatase PhoE
MKVALIRRAKAGPRGSGPKDDSLRALSDEGHAQATGLVESMDGEPIERIVSSPFQRCVQTVAPLAKRRGLEIEVDDRLAEGVGTAKVLGLLRSFGDTPTAVCTHSDVIRRLLSELNPRVKSGSEKLRRRKASTWLLEGDSTSELAAQYRPPPPDLEDDPHRIAVLDLGSTSFHLVVGDVGPDGSIERVTRERDMLRLGALISEHSEIPLADCDRAIESVLHLADVAEAAEAEQLIAIATAALRDARNGRLLAKMFGRILHTKVRILSGPDEARAMFSAIRRRIDLGRKPAFGLDLGGGSLEFAIGDSSDVAWETTLRLGAVRLHNEFADADGELSDDAAKQLRKHIRSRLGSVRDELDVHTPERCIGTGGTIRAVARLLLAADPQSDDTALLGVELEATAIAELATELRRTPQEERRALPGMAARRADILPTGAAIIAHTLAETGFDRVTVCDWGLREGVMLDAVWKPQVQD